MSLALAETIYMVGKRFQKLNPIINLIKAPTLFYTT